jgi:hypothetical protein
VNLSPVLWRLTSRNNRVVYALQEKGARLISIQRLWRWPPFIQTLGFQRFRRFIEDGIVNLPNLPAELDGFPPDIFLWEAGAGRTAIWSIPNGDAFETPLRIYCLRWDNQTLIYLGGFRERRGGETFEERHPAEFLRWQHVISSIIDGLETKDFFRLDDRPGFFETEESDGPADYIILEKYNA